MGSLIFLTRYRHWTKYNTKPLTIYNFNILISASPSTSHRSVHSVGTNYSTKSRSKTPPVAQKQSFTNRWCNFSFVKTVINRRKIFDVIKIEISYFQFPPVRLWSRSQPRPSHPANDPLWTETNFHSTLAVQHSTLCQKSSKSISRSNIRGALSRYSFIHAFIISFAQGTISSFVQWIILWIRCEGFLKKKPEITDMINRFWPH